PPTVRAFHASHVAATLCCFVVLLAPALWNRYPLLQYDTGGYLARWYEGYLVPSRSTVFGLFLHLSEGLHFWPELVVQTGCAIWVVSLVLRAAGFAVGHWHRTLMIAGLALVTALPVLSSTLLTDIFAGLSVLSLHLLIFHRSVLVPIERIGLFFLIAFAPPPHSPTLIVLLAVLVLAVPILLVLSLRPAGALLAGGGAIATGAAMLLAGNLALSGSSLGRRAASELPSAACCRMASSRAISTTIVQSCSSSSVHTATSCRQPPMIFCGATASSMSSVASAASTRRCASSSCTVCRSIRCSKSKPPLRLRQGSCGWSRPVTARTIKSGTPTALSSATFQAKCRPCRAPGNNAASLTSI